MYRYRYNGGTTRGARDRFAKIIAKLGTILSVKGYRYFGRYGTTHEAVMVKGTKGTARFGGCLWGYGGEGPRGTHELLLTLGVDAKLADRMAFRMKRRDELGTDWELFKAIHWHESVGNAEAA